MKPLSQRRAFTGLISLLATAFVIGIWQQRFSWQSDFREDLLKISVCIALSTAVVSFIVWTLMHLKNPSSKNTALARGALAGGLTAVIIIPLPYFAWSFKTEFLSYHLAGDVGFFQSSIGAGLIAIETSLKTFVTMTKASLIAVVGSALVGAGVTHYTGNAPIAQSL